MRLFIAIELSDLVKSMLKSAQTGLRPLGDGVRWVPPELLHLTLKFLGDVRDHDVPSVCDAVSCIASGTAPFSMTVESCGCFPERGPVRIVWAGIREEDGELARCAAAIDGELEALGFPREARAFSPHVTIGRVREDRTAGRLRAAVASARLSATKQVVGSMAVMSSELSPKGPTYAVVSRAFFGQ